MPTLFEIISFAIILEARLDNKLFSNIHLFTGQMIFHPYSNSHWRVRSVSQCICISHSLYFQQKGKKLLKKRKKLYCVSWDFQKYAKNWHTSWTYSEHTLNIPWTYSEHTLNILWTYSEHTLKICPRFDSKTWINHWLSNMDPRDASASKKCWRFLFIGL